jgi:hypothetical protein
LVARLPPIWQLASEGRLRGKWRSTRSAKSRLDRHRIVGRIDGAHAREPREAQQDLAAHRCLATDQAGIFPLRHDV